MKLHKDRFFKLHLVLRKFLTSRAPSKHCPFAPQPVQCELRWPLSWWSSGKGQRGLKAFQGYTEIEMGIPRGLMARALDWGSGGQRFESCCRLKFIYLFYSFFLYSHCPSQNYIVIYVVYHPLFIKVLWPNTNSKCNVEFVMRKEEHGGSNCKGEVEWIRRAQLLL